MQATDTRRFIFSFVAVQKTMSRQAKLLASRIGLAGGSTICLCIVVSLSPSSTFFCVRWCPSFCVSLFLFLPLPMYLPLCV